MKFVAITFSLLMLTGCSAVGLFIPSVKVMVAKAEGEAELAHATYAKQIQIQDAHGKLEAAKMLADAEVARAHGVAEANKIIGTSLKDNEAYLRWLYIEGLKENKGETLIYVPTEAGLPILEAGRLTKKHE